MLICNCLKFKNVKRLSYILILLTGAVLLTNCVTPSHLVMPPGPPSTVTRTQQININEFTIYPLTNKDDISGIGILKNTFADYMKHNDSYYEIQENYPDAYLSVNIKPRKEINRTWILDVAFFYPFVGMIPSPWWGYTYADLTLSIEIPSIDYAQYTFSESSKINSILYPYYSAGKAITQKFRQTYWQLFSNISKYDFQGNWTGTRNITALIESKEKTIISEQIIAEKSKNRPTVAVSKKIPDVDKNIPINQIQKPNTFALIIGNEDYRSYQLDLSGEVNVDFAENDARIFRVYAINTLGVPERNVIMLINGTSGQMHQALTRINLIAKNTKGEANLIFYYAGHGLPDEVTKEPYLIPVDVSGKDLSQAIKLKDVYSKLNEHPNKRVTMFLDACFSGGARSQGLLAARAVKVKPKEQQLKGNLIVFTASSGEESSLPYKEKYHGMFTYFLLKKLQESKGNITYKELSDYLNEKISLESVLVNSKEQNTQTNVSPDATNIWKNWNFLK